MNRGQQIALAAVVAAVTAVLVALALRTPDPGPSTVTDPQPTPSVSASTPPAPSATPPTTEPKPDALKVALLGDSYSGGSDMNKGPEWPLQLAEMRQWDLQLDGSGGTGYFNTIAEDPGSKPIGQRLEPVIRKQPAVVILAGGINDAGAFPSDDIAAEAARIINVLQSEIPGVKVVLFSPFANNVVGPATDEVTAALAQVASAAAVAYVDVSHLLEDRRDLIGSDTVHPTQKGRDYLAERIDGLLPSLR